MDFTQDTKTQGLALVQAVTDYLTSIDPTPAVNPLQAQLDAANASLLSMTSERDTALQAKTAAETRLASAISSLDVADAADATEDAARASVRAKLTGA